MKNLFLLIYSFAALSVFAESHPAWLKVEQLKAIEKIGINVANDITIKGNSRYGFTAKHRLNLEDYICPAGTTVEVSAVGIVIRSSSDKPCRDKKARKVMLLKLDLDGTVSEK